MSPVHVFFIRGFSTSGGDHAAFSFIDLGPVHRHIESGLRKRGIEFHAVTGLGAGPLPDLTDRAYAYLRRHPLWHDPKAKIHLLGHSAGGLTARLLLERLRERGEQGRIASLLTVSTPHRGTRLAEIFVDMPERHRGSAAFFKAIGYDVGAKRELYEDLTEPVLRGRFSELSFVQDHVRVGSVVCSLPREKWCWPLKAMSVIPAFRELEGPSDGVVDRDSQPFGEVIAELSLDHLRQAGFFGGERGFQRLLDIMNGFFRAYENQR
jgi:pimeloyl-ACP methyl ester carboxylesterase